MICEPSMSASCSYARLNRMNAAPRPNCVPWATTLPTRPPMIAPRIAPAIVPISYGVAAHVDRLEGVAELRVPQLSRNRLHEAAADRFRVRGHSFVTHDGQLLTRLGGRLLTELDVLGRRVLVFGWRNPRLGGDQRRREHHSDKCLGHTHLVKQE